MKIVNGICSVIMAASIFVSILITSVEIAAYGDWDFYRAEYEKNDVLTDVDMEMDDLMEVTKEMMAYLKGDRENLVVMTTIGGEEKEFFNEREKLHMEDCQVLFIGAIWIRRICLLLIVASVITMCLINKNGILNKVRRITGGIWKGLVGFIAAMGILIGIIALNFDKAFVTFHHIFFDNDLWILNPETDNLINIVPQTFFMDISARIGIIFGILMILIFSMTIVVERVIIKKLKIKNNQ